MFPLIRWVYIHRHLLAMLTSLTHMHILEHVSSRKSRSSQFSMLVLLSHYLCPSSSTLVCMCVYWLCLWMCLQFTISPKHLCMSIIICCRASYHYSLYDITYHYSMQCVMQWSKSCVVIQILWISISADDRVRTYPQISVSISTSSVSY